MADTKDKLSGVAPKYFGKRHVVAFTGFVICALVNIHRLVIAVAIVAMVKHKHTTGEAVFVSSEISCKSLVSASQNTTKMPFGGDLDWSTELQGYVLGVGYFSHMMSQLPGGRWAETWGAKRTVLTGTCLAAIFTAVTPMATWWSVYAVITVQFFRGMAQGVCTPALFVLMANWFPRSERGFLTTLSMCGYAFGGTVGGVITGWLCDEPLLGWQAAFYVLGISTIVICIFFMFVLYETPQSHPTITPEELKHITDGQESDLSLSRPPIPWRKILTSVPVYALSFGHFGQYWSMTYFLSVHPTYMGTILHFSMTENGAASTIPISLKSVGGLVACFFTSWITKHNYLRVNTLRKLCNSIGSFGFSLCLFGAYWAGCDQLLNIVCFSLSLFFSGIALAGSMITAVDMSPRYSGSLMGLSGTFASTSTFIIPVIVGFLTKNQTMEEWHIVFLISITIVLLCGVIFIVFGSAEVQNWNDPAGKETSNFLPECVNKQSCVTKI